MEKGKVKQFSEMTVEELKAEALGSYSAVWINDCYGTRDVHNYEGAVQELEKRGYEIKEHTYITISDMPVTKEDDGEIIEPWGQCQHCEADLENEPENPLKADDGKPLYLCEECKQKVLKGRAEGNAACIKCGRTDKFLYPNMQCTECYDPDEDKEEDE